MKLVTYKTAEMAREYGFNEKTDKSFSIKNPVADPIGYDKPMQWNETSNNIAAPSQAHLQTWLRDECKIDAIVLPLFRDKCGYDTFKRDGYTFEIVRIEPSTYLVWSDFNQCAEEIDREMKECEGCENEMCLKPSVESYEDALELALQYAMGAFKKEENKDEQDSNN